MNLMMTLLPSLIGIILASAHDTLNDQDEFQPIAGYQPRFDVTLYLSLDQDQAAMEARLLALSEDGIAYAKNMYIESAESIIVARLQLSSPLPKTILAGSNLFGVTTHNETVQCATYQDALSGDSVVYVSYIVTKESNNKNKCYTITNGGEDKDITGCLRRKGSMELKDDRIFLDYDFYDPYRDNSFGTTLQSLSLDANQNFYECPNCPYPLFLLFREFYGTSSYADEWIIAAFDGKSTNFQSGNADFRSQSIKSRAEAVKKGTLQLSVWMYVIGTMEEAISTCHWEHDIRTTKLLTFSNTTGYAESLRTWDKAVALYTGSLEGVSDAGKGIMLYELSDKKCIKFRTCGQKRNAISGISSVNLEIFSLFRKGQLYLSSGRCEAANENKQNIMHLMQIPLIQGTLYYAYINDRQKTSGEKENAIGAVYSASILPLIHDCNAKDSKELSELTAIGTSRPDFLSVKALLERNYKCLHITCSDVGGIYDPTSLQYYKDASPCYNSLSVKSYSVGTIIMLVIFSINFAAVLVLCICCCMFLRRHWNTPEEAEVTFTNCTEFLQSDHSESQHDEHENEIYIQSNLNEKQPMINTGIDVHQTPPRRKASTSEVEEEEEITFISPSRRVLEVAFEHAIV